MFIGNCIKIDTMDILTVQQLIMQKTDPKVAITSESLWKKCGKIRKNDFYKILHELIGSNWVKRTKEGIIRLDFSKKDLANHDNEFTKRWSREKRKIIAKKHKPLFRTTKNGVHYLTKSAQEDLYDYFLECDFNTLNTLNRNFLAHRLKLISTPEFRSNNKSYEELFDYMFNGLINDHKSFKKQIITLYQKSIHNTKFIV